MRKFFTTVFATTALLLTTAAFAQDRTNSDMNRSDRGATMTTTHTAADRDDNAGFNPGWFGLAGLIGLLGLMPRDNTRDRFGSSSPTGTTSTTGVHR